LWDSAFFVGGFAENWDWFSEEEEEDEVFYSFSRLGCYSPALNWFNK